MTDQDRCTDTNPHPAHRTQYGGFGLKDCPGVPMTSREELREERVTTGRLEGDLRSQTRAVREALAERDVVRAQLDTAREDAYRDIARQIDILAADPGILRDWLTTCHPQPISFGELFHALAEKLRRPTPPPSSVPSRRAQEDEPDPWAELDKAMQPVLAQAGQDVALIERAAAVIVAAQKQPHTAPYHWAGALFDAGLLAGSP